MEDHEEQNEEFMEPIEEIISTSKEMNDFGYLVATILDYYIAKHNMDFREDGDEWKEGTKYEKPKAIPNSVDKGIEKAFLTQLKRFQKDG